jgi:tRNA (cytidine/uridine-2'-O-)-methyltransferase
MDYLDRANIVRAPTWEHFAVSAASRRIVLVTRRASLPYTSFQFAHGDIILMGRETAGVPQALHDSLPHSIKIPMRHGERSLNVSLACAIVTAEALRQTAGFPADG